MKHMFFRIIAKLFKVLAPLIKSDTFYLKVRYYCKFKKSLDLENPLTYSEKLQWLKIHDRKPIYTTMVDKVEAKQYVAYIIGEEHIIPNIGVYNSVEEVPWNELPKKFVLKCSHDSGGIVVCKDKTKLDIEKVKRTLREGLKHSYFFENREWPYKDIKPRLICEEYMEDESGYELKDYKWFCFDGEPKALYIATDRGKPNEETKFDFFDADFKHLPIKNGHPNARREIKKPVGFNKMKELAAILSKGIPQLRVDFYDINGKIYFGELTFFHWSGLMPFEPEDWDYTFGSWIKLPKND